MNVCQTFTICKPYDYYVLDVFNIILNIFQVHCIYMSMYWTTVDFIGIVTSAVLIPWLDVLQT